MLVERGARTAVGSRLALRATALADSPAPAFGVFGHGGAAVLGRLLLSPPLEGLMVYYIMHHHALLWCTVHYSTPVHAARRLTPSRGAKAHTWPSMQVLTTGPLGSPRSLQAGARRTKRRRSSGRTSVHAARWVRSGSSLGSASSQGSPAARVEGHVEAARRAMCCEGCCGAGVD